MKRYIIYAGVNGAGKSTLFSTVSHHADLPRVNADEILREFGDWRKVEDVLKAGKIAVERLRQYIDQGVTFTQETTLCGKSVFRNIEKAIDESSFFMQFGIGL